MTSSHGYFLHVSTGEIIPMHSSAVIQSPECYGLSESDIAGLCPVEDRIGILEAALSQGWIRVRHRKHQVSVSFLTEWFETLETVARSIEELGLGECCWIDFRQLATGETLGVQVYELRRHFVEESIIDLLDRIEMK